MCFPVHATKTSAWEAGHNQKLQILPRDTTGMVL
jgi:hypothetical protein